MNNLSYGRGGTSLGTNRVTLLIAPSYMKKTPPM